MPGLYLPACLRLRAHVREKVTSERDGMPLLRFPSRPLLISRRRLSICLLVATYGTAWPPRLRIAFRAPASLCCAVLRSASACLHCRNEPSCLDGVRFRWPRKESVSVQGQPASPGMEKPTLPRAQKFRRATFSRPHGAFPLPAMGWEAMALIPARRTSSAGQKSRQTKKFESRVAVPATDPTDRGSNKCVPHAALLLCQS